VVAECASGPCSTDTSFTASQGVSVANSGTIYFNSLGQPVNSAGAPLAGDASFPLSYPTGSGTSTYRVPVQVDALTGRVSVGPQQVQP
jgi:hypothetical protein